MFELEDRDGDGEGGGRERKRKRLVLRSYSRCSLAERIVQSNRNSTMSPMVVFCRL